MAIYRQDLAKQLEYGIRTGFLKGRKAYAPVRSAIAIETQSTGKEETYSDVGTISMPQETTDKPAIRGMHEVNVTVTNKDWDITVGVTHNAINDNRVGNIETWAQQAGRQFERHMDKLCFQALNAGDSDTYGKAYDGKNFFANDHVDSGADYTTVQDNMWGFTLNDDNFETVEVAANLFKDGRGEECGYMYDLLVVAPNNKRIGTQIAENDWMYDTSSREINPYQGTQLLISPYLDSTAWFLVASSEMIKPIILQVRQAPMLKVWDDDLKSEGGMRYFKWSARYNVGYGDWRTVAMGNT